jgi:hypothetical protein
MAAWLGTVASPFVPRELITAPMPIARLLELDMVVASLRSAGAYGRGAVLWDSLGLHFNIDPPRLDAATVMAFLKAFFLVNDRLRRGRPCVGAFDGLSSFRRTTRKPTSNACSIRTTGRILSAELRN